MNILRNLSFVLGLGLGVWFQSAVPLWAASLSAKEIMSQNEENRRLGEIEASAVLNTKSEAGGEKEKHFTWWKKLKKDGVHYQTLTRFHSPPTVKGEGILILEGDQNDNEVLMYLPNFKKVRRVENQQQSGSFMGSGFSYSDIATPHLDEYQYKLSKEEPCCYVVEAVPIDKVKERMDCSRTVNWILKENFMTLKIDYYDLDGKLSKHLQADQIKKVDPQRNKWMAHWLKMDNIKAKKTTLLEFSEVKVNQGLSDALFTQQNLARVQ